MPQFLLFMALFNTQLWAGTYSLADLEVLVAEESYEEFFEHALDIRPIERQDAWKNMVTKMGDIYSQKVLQKVDLHRNDFTQIEGLYSWPALKNDDIFRLRRQEIGLKHLKKCLKGDNPCWNDLKLFWEKDKTDADTAYKLAEITYGLQNSPLSTWTLLDVALKSNLSEFYCKNDFVMNALWGKIEIDYIKLGPDGDLMKKIDQTIHPDCMPILLKEAHARLYHPPKTFDRELAFQIIKSQNKAGQDVTDFFYTVYLLDNPSQGELFNYSWSRIKELGRHSERREKVLNKIKRLDPLPDAILSTLDQAKKRVVLRHLKGNFPEYLDFYTDQCVKFYGGKESFPSGNPTIHCQDFMNSELAPQIIDSNKIDQYQKVRLPQTSI